MKSMLSLFFSLLLVSTSSRAGPPLLQCHDLGEGEIDRVEIAQGDGELLDMTEFLDSDRVREKKIPRSEWESKSIHLTDYYGYDRILKKSGHGEWFVEWSCGEVFKVQCLEHIE